MEMEARGTEPRSVNGVKDLLCAALPTSSISLLLLLLLPLY